jgi:hypothetical protein
LASPRFKNIEDKLLPLFVDCQFKHEGGVKIYKGGFRELFLDSQTESSKESLIRFEAKLKEQLERGQKALIR